MIVYLCSCGFATDDAGWIDGHMDERPGHFQRRMVRDPLGPRFTLPTAGLTLPGQRFTQQEQRLNRYKDILTTSRPEGPGFGPSPARVPVSSPAASGDTRNV